MRFVLPFVGIAAFLGNAAYQVVAHAPLRAQLAIAVCAVLVIATLVQNRERGNKDCFNKMLQEHAEAERLSDLTAPAKLDS